MNNASPNLIDYGPDPFVVNIDMVTKRNQYFRRVLWTGSHLQMTVMSINVGEEIGIEMHSNLDQFIRVEDGCGLVKIGNSKDEFTLQRNVDSNYGIFIPAGTWHNLINIGKRPLKVYSIYAPPAHPYGTVHETKAIADAAHEHTH